VVLCGPEQARDLASVSLSLSLSLKSGIIGKGTHSRVRCVRLRSLARNTVRSGSSLIETRNLKVYYERMYKIGIRQATRSHHSNDVGDRGNWMRKYPAFEIRFLTEMHRERHRDAEKAYKAPSLSLSLSRDILRVVFSRCIIISNQWNSSPLLLCLPRSFPRDARMTESSHAERAVRARARACMCVCVRVRARILNIFYRGFSFCTVVSR